MKYSIMASALVAALFTSTVTTRAEETVATTAAAPLDPLVARSLNFNTHAVNLIQQPGAPVGSVPKGPSIKKVLILVAVLGAAYIVLMLSVPRT